MPSTSLSADYSRLVQDGHYHAWPSGLRGRHDLVRRHWEDQLTRFSLLPFLAEARRRLQRAGRGLRILDLGCGNGEGWELLTRIPAAGDPPRLVLEPADIEHYLGIDLCPEMVDRARQRLPQLAFREGDLRDMEGLLAAEPPFDIYFSGYGSLSHLTSGELSRALTAISRHARGPALVVLDLLGRYSLEWPVYWRASAVGDGMAPYNMLWLYPREEWPRRRAEFADYRLRFWGGEELQEMIWRNSSLASRLQGIRLFDRSVLVGRHMSTGEFNTQSWPIREAVSSLWELNQVTRLDDLLLPHLPPELPTEADWLRTFQGVWNGVVQSARHLLTHQPDYGRAEECLEQLPQATALGVASLVQFRQQLDKVYGDIPLCNTLEPQLAVLLRQTEYRLQQGRGCGHGLLAILELF